MLVVRVTGRGPRPVPRRRARRPPHNARFPRSDGDPLPELPRSVISIASFRGHAQRVAAGDPRRRAAAAARGRRRLANAGAVRRGQRPGRDGGRRRGGLLADVRHGLPDERAGGRLRRGRRRHSRAHLRARRHVAARGDPALKSDDPGRGAGELPEELLEAPPAAPGAAADRLRRGDDHGARDARGVRDAAAGGAADCGDADGGWWWC